MTIPLPDLDTRRWSDLTEQGRASIVRASPSWTDHNIHDPGITLMELFAWVVESSIYRTNRIPERHVRKMLALAGFAPTPPRPGRVVLDVELAPGTGPLHLPAGVVFRHPTAHPWEDGEAEGGEGAEIRLPYRTLAPVTLLEGRIASLHVFDGEALSDRTGAFSEGLPVPLFGDDPAAPDTPDSADSADAPAFYLGFDRPLPVARTISLFVHVRGAVPGELARVVEEAAARAADCRPPERRCTPCAPPGDLCGPEPEGGEEGVGGGDAASAADAAHPAGADVDPPRHHDVRLVWEVHTPSGWLELPRGEEGVWDGTYALTVSGPIRVRLNAPMAALRLPGDPADRFYLRARLVRGRFDAPPTLDTVAMNAVDAAQEVPAWQEHPLAPGYGGGATLSVGETARLALALDADGRITHIERGGDGDPEAVILGHAPAIGAQPERLRMSTVRVGPGSGLPAQVLELLPGSLLGRTLGVVTGCPPRCPPAHASGARLRFWSVDTAPGPARTWLVRPDHDASTPADRHLVLDVNATAALTGDDVRGRTLAPDETLLASFDVTLGGAGGAPADGGWQLGEDPVNVARLGLDRAAVAAASVRNRRASFGEKDAEDTGAAAARAAALLWAHERLVELAEEADSDTLDGLDPQAVLDRAAPPRASTSLDFERLALDVPGTRVQRARAWGGHDPRLACAALPGTVTLVVVPSLPVGRPAPSAGLLRAVRRYLDRRRLLGTRLLVRGPVYVDLAVEARVRACEGADAARVAARVRARLRTFFDPLRGGWDGRGWPFGRDVYRGEVLQVVDAVEGVDHVLSLRLLTGSGAAECDNVCVPRTGLVASDDPCIEVVA